MFWNKKKSTEKGEKQVLFFASDLHGSNVCFKKFVNGAKFYGADALIMGGDATGKAIIPICKQSDGTHLAYQTGGEVTLESRAEIEEFTKRVGDSGFYAAEMTEDEYQELANDEERRHILFKKLVVERVAEWCEFAGKKLKDTGIPLITSPGNDDFFEIDNVLNNSPHVHYHDMEITELGAYEILHCGGSTETPWDTEREFTEAEYQAKFDELIPQVKDMSRCIFNVHCPPYGTILDACPKLDENLQVEYDMGNPVSMHAGMKTVYTEIEKHQPLLGVHGHIHEGRGEIKIGRTVCVNPGSVYPEGVLQGVLITLKGGEVKGIQMTQG
jgi:Icc-related predicted phosphoesterase